MSLKWLVLTLFLVLVGLSGWVRGCGPGRGAFKRRGPKKLTPLVFKQHVPNVPEHTLTASGAAEGKVSKNDSRFRDLQPNYSGDIVFKDEEGTGADRLMTGRCNEKLNTLAISVMNQWPGIKLVVIEGWDEEGDHAPESLHYEGRAVDIMTSDREKSKLGMLARLAVEAGFDWVFYESRNHIHCSVKSESSQAAKYGGCFTGESTVLTSTGVQRPLSQLRVGESILATDPSTKKLVFSEVLLFLDYDPTQNRQFLHITLKSGRTLTVTPNHLVSLTDGRTVFAETLVVNQKLLVSDSVETLNEDIIINITRVYRRGVYAPLTRAGTVVVNGIVASCYATVDSQDIAHYAFMPLRLVWNVKLGLYRVWTLLNKPLEGWKRNAADEISKKQPDVGVHWYAKVLYSAATYLIPSRLHS
ncbi:sonic hedgehog protein A [Sitophilus oryzae]|uniref:Hedgehog protein n=1 Tax=Sitophilus oryzae TaxID=7048 RepID=A0A6J2YVS3_SITOR|nr:sonic hedgehog protein A [Sitophilus oryzae]